MLENDMEDLKLSLKQEMERLVKEIGMKDGHIKRLERRNLSLDDEVLEAEKTFENTIKKQKLELMRLNKETLDLSRCNSDLSERLRMCMLKVKSLEDELSSLKQQEAAVNLLDAEILKAKSHNEGLQVDLESYKTKNQIFKKEVEELNQTLKEMISSIRTLEISNKMYAEEEKLLRMQLEGLSKGVTRPNDGDIGKATAVREVRELQDKYATRNMETRATVEGQLKNKILIYGDETARGCAATLSTILNGAYCVMGEVRSNMQLSELGRNMFKLCLQYTQNDYVIFCVKIDCFSRIRQVDLREILALGRFTNLIVCFTYESLNYNQKVSQIYKKINTFGSLYIRKNKNISLRFIDNHKNNYDYRLNRKELCKLFVSYVEKKLNFIRSGLISIPTNLSPYEPALVSLGGGGSDEKENSMINFPIQRVSPKVT